MEITRNEFQLIIEQYVKLRIDFNLFQLSVQDLLNVFFNFITHFKVLKQRKIAMGCVPDRTKKQNRDIHQPTQATENIGSVSGTPIKVTSQKTMHIQQYGAKAGYNRDNNGLSRSSTSSNGKRNENDAIQQLIKKYKISTKQNMYKTNSIHQYAYQKLVVFNPLQDNCYSKEKELLDRSYNFNLSRELVSQNKIRLSKK